MKKLISLLLILAACHSGQKFTQLKKGMTAKEVIAIVGEPASKVPVFGIEWWVYDKQNKLIVMSPDTVINVKLDMKGAQDSIRMIGHDIKLKMDSFRNK